MFVLPETTSEILSVPESMTSKADEYRCRICGRPAFVNIGTEDEPDLRCKLCWLNKDKPCVTAEDFKEKYNL